MSYKYHKDVLKEEIKLNNIEIMAEVGVWKSHMLRSILRSDCKNTIKEYWAIDQWKVLGKEHGRMAWRTQENWDEYYYGSCRYMPYFKQLRVLRLTSEEASKLFWKEYFDLVYIDASHFYKDVLKDIKYWFPLVKKGGIISGHDYGTGARKGHTVKPAVDEFFGEGNVELFADGVWLKRL